MKIPKATKIKILRILKNKLRIPTEQMLEIVAKDTGADLSDQAVRAFWLKKCQQLMASVRDQDGRRMVFSISGRSSVNGVAEYIVVAACRNADELAAINHGLRRDVAGLEESIAVLNWQLDSMAAIQRELSAAIENLKKERKNNA